MQTNKEMFKLDLFSYFTYQTWTQSHQSRNIWFCLSNLAA